MIIDWQGYGCGAVTADTIGLRIVRNDKDGNTYAIFNAGLAGGNALSVCNVHPATYNCDDENERKVYPIRWFLDASEVSDMLTSTNFDN